ncbi:MAG: type IV pilus modification PilV family protein [Longimicrobiales bacterium]
MRQAGFTLIEVMFVMVLLTFGLLALASASTVALHQSAIAGRQDVRWTAIQRWSDSLTVLGHGNVTAGSGTVDGISATWAVDSIAPDLERVTVSVTGDPDAGAWQETLILHLYR